MHDTEIIELYFSRSENAIAETDKKYGRYCRFIARNILCSDEDSEECVNDTYLRAWNAIPPKRPNRLQTFLGRLTRNLALNRYEKRSAKKRGGGEIPLLLDELSECVGGNADAYDEIYLRCLLDDFLEGLDVKSRKIFVRRYWYISSVEEIAREYGMSSGNVAVVLYRARKKLRETLEREGVML